MAPKSLKLFFALLVASVLLVSTVHCEDLDNSESSDDLETAEFLFWPKLFFAKAALAKPWAITKTVQVDTTPVKYSYKPVTYTAYKWVPVPYQYTVQQPYVDTSSTSVSSGSSSTVVRAPFVNVDVVKSVNTGGFSGSSTGTPSSDSVSTVVRAPFVNVDVAKSGNNGVAVEVGPTNGASLVSSSATSSTTDF